MSGYAKTPDAAFELLLWVFLSFLKLGNLFFVCFGFHSVSAD